MAIDDKRPITAVGLRGFVPFVALLLWFLIAILAAAPAKAAGARLVASDLLPEIEAALVAHGAPMDAVISLASPNQTIAADFEFGHVSINPLSGRFVIRVENDNHAITGYARATASFPALRHSVARGALITDDNVVFIDTVSTRPGRYALGAEDLVGMKARRALNAGAPIRLNDVEAPTLVKKGALVTLTYQMEGLRMSHQGIALAAGVLGEVVAVKNIDSERTLKGVVADENLVTIVPRRSAIEG